MELRRASETAGTVTLEWTPPAGADFYGLYAGGAFVSQATRTNKDGTPRTRAVFGKVAAGRYSVVALLDERGATDPGYYAVPGPGQLPRGAF